LYSKKSVLRFLLKGQLENTPEELLIYKKFIISSVIEYHVIENIFHAHNRIQNVIINNGTLLFEKLFIHLSSLRNINFMTFETFIGNQSIIYKKNDEVMNLNWDKEAEKYYSENELTPAKVIAVENHFHNIRNGKGMYAKLNDGHNEKLLDRIDKYAVLFTNLNFDASVIDKSSVFSSMRDWIEEVIHYWEHNVSNIALVIRVHPGEIKLRTATNEFMGTL